MTCAARNAVNITWIGGDSEDYTMRYKDSSGDAIDLTGATAAMEIRKSFRDSATVIPTKSASIVDADGVIKFSFTPLDTSTLLGDAQKIKFAYDTQLTTAAGEVKTLTGGELTVTAGITE